jgi:hypothetical protein
LLWLFDLPGIFRKRDWNVLFWRPLGAPAGLSIKKVQNVWNWRK